MAWIAPVPWLLLVGRDRLPGRRPYLALWLAGCLFWLGSVHWLRLPHPATSIGWVALSCYLGVYLPVFIGLARVAVHRLGVPVVLAAPILWTGLEYAQAHLLTGFSMASLGHTQYRWLSLIQVADLAGAYAVGFVVMLIAACLARIWQPGKRRLSLWALVPAAAVLCAAVGYGQWRLSQPQVMPGPKIALIQGSVDTELKHDPARQALVYKHYFELSQQAVRQHPDLDLVVWPETMYRDTLYLYSADAPPPQDWRGSPEQFLQFVAERRAKIESQALLLDSPLLLGIDTVHFGNGEIARYNSALFVDRHGIGPRYDKMHRVMFGEYVPFAKRFPWLYQLTPLGGGLDAGTETPVFQVGRARLAANICFESTVPHLIRGQVAGLRRQGTEPDVLVNLTNDGWFWGSSELELHLMCGVFRAVECRKPFLIAANTGFSAWIDSEGRIRKRGPRRDSDVIIVDGLKLDSRKSPYTRLGDWPAGLCLLASVGVAMVGVRGRRAAGERGSGFQS